MPLSIHRVSREVARASAVVWLVACSSSDTQRTNSSQTGGGGASGRGGSSATGGSGATATGTGGAGTGAGQGGAGLGGTGLDGAGFPVDTPAAVPFAADQFFVASGFMGDGATPGLIVLDNTCQTPRPAGAVGQCYRFTYQPGAVGWGGVYWQYPANNWGTLPGKRIAQGATKVRFYAAGAQGGEPVSFILFGVGVGDATATYVDPAKITVTETLTTTMTPYEINLVGQAYDAVIGGFGWVSPPAGVVLPADASAPLLFYIDGIEWQ